MTARLISWSQSPDNKTLLEQVAYAARVSNPENQHANETAEKLVRYLITHKHWSPLEMVSVCLEVETTRDIARQLLRHRSFSFQEFSQRYAFGTTLGFDTRETRLQDLKNRQNSIETNDMILQTEWARRQLEMIDVSRDMYTWAIEHGIAKEQARVILPEGLTRSRLYVNGTLRSWIHYIQLRSANGTQKEHQAVAIACANAIAEVFPMIREFLE